MTLASPTGLVGGFEWMHTVGHGPLDTCTAHRWKLGEPNGPLTEGTCRNCGATRMFGNSPDAIDEMKCIDCGAVLHSSGSKRCRKCAPKAGRISLAPKPKAVMPPRVYELVRCQRCGREFPSNMVHRHTPEFCARQFCACGARKSTDSIQCQRCYGESVRVKPRYAACVDCGAPKTGRQQVTHPRCGACSVRRTRKPQTIPLPTMTAEETDRWVRRRAG